MTTKEMLAHIQYTLDILEGVEHRTKKCTHPAPQFECDWCELQESIEGLKAMKRQLS